MQGLWLKGSMGTCLQGGGGGVQAGVAVTADASVGLEVHKATGGTVLEAGHLVASFVHGVCKGGFPNLGCTFVVDKVLGGKCCYSFQVGKSSAVV